MADLADVENAIRDVIGTALYPAGVPDGATPLSPVAGKAVRVYRDWPIPADLNPDLTAGIVNVSIFAQPNMTHKSTRYPQTWQRQGPKLQPTLSWSIAGNVATLTGTVLVPQNVALILDQQDFVYAVQASDTVETIVAALTALVMAAGVPATATDNALTLLNSHRIVGRVGRIQPIIRELRRQEQGILVSAWCPGPDSRDAVCTAIDGALAAINFLTLVDGSAARITYRATSSTDRAENASLFRRDLVYTVEYATTEISTAPQAIVWRIATQGNHGPPFATEV